jgi:hypothetical protein
LTKLFHLDHYPVRSDHTRWGPRTLERVVHDLSGARLHERPPERSGDVSPFLEVLPERCDDVAPFLEVLPETSGDVSPFLDVPRERSGDLTPILAVLSSPEPSRDEHRDALTPIQDTLSLPRRDAEESNEETVPDSRRWVSEVTARRALTHARRRERLVGMEDRHVAVLLEDLRSQFKAFGEDLLGVRAQLTRETTRLSGEIEHVARHLGGKIDSVASDVAVLKTDTADMKSRLTRVEERLNGAPPPSPRPDRKRRK